MTGASPGLQRSSGPAQFARGTFVGRQRELGELKAALADAQSGQGRLVMLVGEPGIGKTRTAQELASYAQNSGMQVWWGRCYEEQGMPPYWPWVQALRPYVQEQDPEQLRSLMGSGASDIAEVLPDVKARLPDLPPPLQLDSPEYARFRLFDAITTFLKNTSQTHPLVLVLDDLHWADRSTMLLLEFLSQELQTMPLLLIGTYRDVEVSQQHPLAQTLGNLVRTSGFARLQLPGLSQPEVAQLLAIIPGWESSPQTAAAIHQRTEGNPLFVGELLRALNQEGLDQSALLTQVPEGVRDAIRRRTSRLSEQCHRALVTASVIGRGFELKLLSRLSSGVSEEQLLAVIDEALEAHLIEELPGSAEGYQFSHALVQETLASELSAARRVRLHARIGEALEKIYADNPEAHAAELAHHFAQAQPVLGSERLVRYSGLAGEQALAAYAWEEALERFERGLAAKGVAPEGTEPAIDAETAALLFGLGRAQIATMERNELQKAIVSLSRAFDYYAETGDVDRVVAIAEYPFLPMVGQRIGGIQLIARALALVPPDSHAAGRLLSRYGAVLELEEGDYEGARQAFSHALDIARRTKDLTLEIDVLSSAARVDYYHLNYGESLDKSLEAIALARYVDDPIAQVVACENAASSFLRTGELEGARQQAADTLLAARRLRDRSKMAQAFWINAAVAAQAGDWEVARQFSDLGLEVSPQLSTLLFNRVLLEYEVGNIAQGELFLQRLKDTARLSAPESSLTSAFYALIATLIHRITGSGTLLHETERLARSVVALPLTPRRSIVLASEALALIAVSRDDVADAQKQYAVLHPLRGVILTNTLGTDRLLGLLSQTMGNLDQAAAHFEDALTFCRQAGYRPELAWTCHDCADALLQHNNPGDRAKAMSLLDESLSISTQLGMRPLKERVVVLQELAQSQPERATAYPDGLTQREVEVLRLVASGKTSAEIAGELVLSRRTVERHISNIYNKTNTRSRAEATAFAFTHGLAPLCNS